MSEGPRQILARLFKRGAVPIDDFKRLDAALVHLDVLRDADHWALRHLADGMTEIRAALARLGRAGAGAAAPGGEAGGQVVPIAAGLAAAAEGPRQMPVENSRTAVGG